MLSHPLRHRSTEEVEVLIARLARLDRLARLARLDLRPVDRMTAEVATSLAAEHGLRAADAVHHASAVVAGGGSLQH